MQIKIIEFESEDYKQMVQLRIDALLLPIGVPATYIIPENEKHDIFIAAFLHKEIIGCCVLTKKNDEEIQLRQMAVHPLHQGKKIGVAIIKFAEIVAKESGLSKLMMNARDPVIEFYEKCGYRIVGEQFFEVGIAHHKMEKNLVDDL